jgi:hypothetical protein
MDVDALACEIADRLQRCDLAVPPFPAYFPRWMERSRVQAREAGVPDQPDDRREDLPVASVSRADIGRSGDLDSYLYRVEPGEAALLLVMRGESLAYVASAGRWFDLPDQLPSGPFPPYDLATMAVWARSEGELDLMPGGQYALHAGGPVHVGFALGRARYESLDDAARTALHDACIPIARDSALLFCARSGPLQIVLHEPDTPQEIETGTRRPGPERLIAEFSAT